MKKIVLASSSPRRIELLKLFLNDFNIIPSNYKEEITDAVPYQLAMELARGKAFEVASRLDENNIIISADTIVVKGDNVLGKPKDANEAFKMLKMLSGQKHQVVTGFCLIDNSTMKVITDYEITDVYFKELTELEIDAYIKTGEPFDKAGAYAIQGFASIFVKKIDGCYFNVVGLPLYKLSQALLDVGVNLLNKECYNG